MPRASMRKGSLLAEHTRGVSTRAWFFNARMRLRRCTHGDRRSDQSWRTLKAYARLYAREMMMPVLFSVPLLALVLGGQHFHHQRARSFPVRLPVAPPLALLLLGRTARLPRLFAVASAHHGAVSVAQLVVLARHPPLARELQPREPEGFVGGPVVVRTFVAVRSVPGVIQLPHQHAL